MINRSAVYAVRFALQALRRRKARPAPLFASLFVTSRCNLRCKSCFFYRNFSFQVIDMDFDFAVRCCEQVAECGVPISFLGGGEPLLYPHLFSIAQRLKRRGVMPVLFTNGMLVSHENSRFVVKHFSHVFVSIDGDREVNDLRRGAGSYEGAIQAVRLLKKADRDAKVFVRCTVDKNNVSGLIRFIGDMKRIGATGVSLQPDCHHEAVLNRPDRSNNEIALGGLKARFGTFILEDEAQIELMIQYLETGRTPLCDADKLAHISILPDGTVSACCFYPLPLGNVGEEELQPILNRMYAVKLAGIGDCHGCCRADFFMTRMIESGPWRQLVHNALSYWKKAWPRESKLRTVDSEKQPS